jgi:hypothetical protein
MLRHASLRRALVPLALAAMLVSGPPAARAADGSVAGTTTGDSAVGVAMAMGCGASIRVSIITKVPIVIGVTIAMCALMLMDALASRDSGV